MTTEILLALFKRDLTTLKTEIKAYKKEANLWIIPKGISNSAGNLCLHLVGNLNHFVGQALGQSGYVRQRDLEFSLRHIPKKVLLEQIEATIVSLELALNQLTEDDLQKEYTYRIFKKPKSTEHFLVHLAMHLSYHLGQINYHRRLLDQ